MRRGGHSPWGSPPSVADSAESRAPPHLWVTTSHPCPGPEQADPLLLDPTHDRAGCSGDHGGLSEPGRWSPAPGPAGSLLRLTRLTLRLGLHVEGGQG